MSQAEFNALTVRPKYVSRCSKSLQRPLVDLWVWIKKVWARRGGRSCARGTWKLWCCWTQSCYQHNSSSSVRRQPSTSPWADTAWPLYVSLLPWRPCRWSSLYCARKLGVLSVQWTSRVLLVCWEQQQKHSGGRIKLMSRSLILGRFHI